MYCTKCGKWISYDATVCNECKAAEAAQNAANNDSLNHVFASSPYGAPADSQNRMFGFGKALTSTILGFVGFIVACIAMVAGIADTTTAVILFIMGTGMAVVSLIFGIQSIFTFKRRSAEGCAKPIATLVLGIVGLSLAALAMIYLLLSLITITTFSGASYYSAPYYY